MRGKDGTGLTVGDVIEQARQQALKGAPLDDKLNKVLICCGCLGDRSDDINEIVECDGCGVSVHEGTLIENISTPVLFLIFIYICFTNKNFRLLRRI